MLDKLPRINPQKFAHSYLIKGARRSLKVHVWPFLNAVGKPRIEHMIETNQSLVELTLSKDLPENWQAFFEYAPNYRWILAVIDEEDLLSFVPPWLAELVTSDDKKWSWFVNEVTLIRRRIFKNEH